MDFRLFTGSNRLARAALRGFALTLRVARALGVKARWTFPSGANRRVARSGLFDPGAYLQAYPHAGLGVLSPLDHFMAHGARAGCDPNPYFSVAWYLANNRDVARAGVNPLLHYIRTGEQEGRAPSRKFDPVYYAARHPDAVAAGGGLLAHFLRQGRIDGRLPKTPDLEDDGAPAAGEADIAVVKPARVSPGEAAVLFACRASAGRVRPHALAYLDALRSAGRKTVVVVATDAPFEAPPALLERADGLYVRPNVGPDFAAWSHVLQVEPSLYATGSLLLVNDGVLPPADIGRIGRLLDGMEGHPGDIVGLTDCYEPEWHIQSYAMLLKPAALRFPALQRFMLAVRNLPDKAEAVEAYELRFGSAMRVAGLAAAVLFPAADRADPTIEGWRDLLGRGFPFVRLAALQGRDSPEDVGDWSEVLAAQGFDLDLATRAMAPQPPAGHIPNDGLLAKATARTAKALTAGMPLKVDYLGPWNYDSDLGAASRGMMSALWRTPFRLDIRSVRQPFHTHARLAPMVDATEVFEPADVAIIHLNPDGMALMTQAQRRRSDRAGLTIGLWVWEMEGLPEDWRDRMGTVDAVWTPSRFCAAAFGSALGDRPVHVIPHVVEAAPMPGTAETTATRDAFGVPAGRRTILYAFDGASFLARKNPFALIRAFAASGLGQRGWTLVLKTKNMFDQPQAGAALADLAAAPHVLLIDASATDQQMRALMAAADIYASPHCAEGFGLTIAEAMAMGKSVVATDYSGPRDFMDADCGYPVAYRTETLERDHGPYRRGGVWARIDETDLARTLVRAADDLDAGRGMGDRARARIAERLSPDAVAHAMRDSLGALTGRRP